MTIQPESAEVERSPEQPPAPTNLLKVRGEPFAINFCTTAGDNLASGARKEFKMCPTSQCNWLKRPIGGDYPTFSSAELRKQIEPWLTALFQSDHLSLLVGAGLTQAAHSLARKDVHPPPINIEISPAYEAMIKQAAKASAVKTGRGEEPNFEDILRIANEVYAGLKYFLSGNSAQTDQDKNIEMLGKDIENALILITQTVLQSETNIAEASDDKQEDAFNYLIGFLMSFACRTGTRDRLHIFTTNYDRVIEAAAEIAGLHLIDRFVGSLSPIFRSSRLSLDMHYNPPGIRGEPRYLEGVVRYTKLHGSIDWISVGREIRRMGLPFGSKDVNPYLNAPGLRGAKCHELMIYPNAAKDQETSLYPYVELFRDFAAAICRPNNTLVTYGYSFGDAHINRVISDMLTIPSTHLVIISYSDMGGRIERFCKRVGRSPQITLLVGPDLGNIKDLVDNYLPKAAIDRTTIKMSDLLRARHSSEQHEAFPPENAEIKSMGE